MKKKVITSIISAGIILSLFVGCNNIENKKEENTYIDEINYRVNRQKYDEAVCYMFESGNDFKEFDKYRDLFVDGYIPSSTIDYEGVNIPANEIIDAFAEYAPIEYDFDNLEEGNFPIIGDYLNVVGYGSKEDFYKSIEELKEYPEIRFIEASVYKDFIVYTLDSKINGIFLVEVQLKEEKIESVVRLYEK